MDMLRGGADHARRSACSRCGLFGIAGRSRSPSAWAAIGLAPPGQGAARLAAARARRRRLRSRRRERGGSLRRFALAGRPDRSFVAGRRALVRARSWPPRARFVDVFLLNHNLQRFTSTIHNHPGPFFYYLPVLLAWLFSLVGPGRCPGLGAARPRRSRATCSCCCGSLLPLLFFSAAGSKLPGYILPCLPPLALLMGRAAAGWRRAMRCPSGPGLAWSRSSAWRSAPSSATTPALVAARLRRSGLAAGAAARPVGADRDVRGLAGLRAKVRRTRCALLRVGGAGLLLLLALRRAADPARAAVGPRPLPARGTAARCWPGARGARPGCRATSTTTARCGRSRISARSRRPRAAARRWFCAARPNAANCESSPAFATPDARRRPEAERAAAREPALSGETLDLLQHPARRCRRPCGNA